MHFRIIAALACFSSLGTAGIITVSHGVSCSLSQSSIQPAGTATDITCPTVSFQVPTHIAVDSVLAYVAFGFPNLDLFYPIGQPFQLANYTDLTTNWSLTSPVGISTFADVGVPGMATYTQLSDRQRFTLLPATHGFSVAVPLFAGALTAEQEFSALTPFFNGQTAESLILTGYSVQRVLPQTFAQLILQDYPLSNLELFISVSFLADVPEPNYLWGLPFAIAGAILKKARAA